MDHIQNIEQLGRNRHCPEHATFTFLQTFKDDNLGGKVDAFGRQGKRLRNSATAVKDHTAEGSNLARCSSSRLQERVGELLTERKRKCQHGEWLQWLEANVQMGQKTVWNYTQVFEHPN